MREIGFHGGSSLCELGPASGVVLVFEGEGVEILGEK